MKKIISFILLGVLLFNLFGYFALQQIGRWMAREEFEEKLMQNIDEKELTKFEFTDAEYKKIDWEEKEKEFKQNGEFYDVVKIEKKDKKTTVYCINDKKEAELMAHYDKLIDEQNDRNSNKDIQKIFKFLFQNLYNLETNHFLFTPKSIEKKKAHYTYNSNLESIDLNLLSPPPKFF